MSRCFLETLSSWLGENDPDRKTYFIFFKKKKKIDNFLDAKNFQGPAHSPILYLNLLLALTDLNPR